MDQPIHSVLSEVMPLPSMLNFRALSETNYPLPRISENNSENIKSHVTSSPLYFPFHRPIWSIGFISSNTKVKAQMPLKIIVALVKLLWTKASTTLLELAKSRFLEPLYYTLYFYLSMSFGAMRDLFSVCWFGFIFHWVTLMKNGDVLCFWSTSSTSCSYIVDQISLEV